MDDSSLLKISLITAVLGIGLLVVGSWVKEPVNVTAGELTPADKGEIVTVTGIARDVTSSGGHLFFTLEDDTGKIRAVFFERDMARHDFYPLDLQENDMVTVEGRVTLYEGHMEIITDRLTLLENSDEP